MRKLDSKKKFFSLAKSVLLVLPLVLLIGCNEDKQLVVEEKMGVEEFISFEQFFQNTESATFEDYSNKAGFNVLNEYEFLGMKSHLLTLYSGVKVNHSFVMDDAMHIDCIDINTQPGLFRDGKKLELAEAPPPMDIFTDKEDDTKSFPIDSMMSRDKMDKFGNLIYCEEGFIPMRRITLEELMRFETLEDFFNKYGKAGLTGPSVVK